MFKPKVIVTDMDDVLVDLLPAWISTLNFRYNQHVKVDDIVEWDMRKAFPTLKPEQIYSVLGEQTFWSLVTPKGDAVQGLTELHDMGHKIYVCTATHYKNLSQKLNSCLTKYFPWLTYTDIIMCHNKQMIKCDYIIDDYPENIRGHSAVSFLMDAPHNRSRDKVAYDFRVKTFRDIIQIIDELEVAESE